VDATRKNLSKELGAGESPKRELGNRFRKEARDLGLLLDPDGAYEGPLSSGIAVLRERSDRVAPLIRKLRDLERAGRLTQPLAALAASHAHMHANRLLRSAHRRQELVLYDFLSRLYETRVMRGGGGSGRLPAADPSLRSG
jgi:thiopeptide-type bacteriocin biosynthesis protein